MGLRVSAIVLVLVCGSNQGFRCLSDLETGKAATQGAPFSGLVDYGDMLTGILSYFCVRQEGPVCTCTMLTSFAWPTPVLVPFV